MKKIAVFITILFCLFPIGISANSVQNIYNNIEIKGIDEKKYDINKTISSEKITITLKNKTTKQLYSWSFDRKK